MQAAEPEEELAEEHVPRDPLSWHAHHSAPQWVPSPLVEEWVTKPGTLAKLREGLDRATSGEKVELIQTGLRRKGTVSPSTPVAQRLARLCFTSRAWWDRCARWAYEDYVDLGQALSSEDLQALPEGLEDLRERYSSAVLVLACILLGLDGDEVRVFALEAEEQLEQGPAASYEATLQDLQDRIRLSHDDLTAARAELRQARRENKAAERRIAGAAHGARARREADKATDSSDSELERLHAELAEALADNAALAGTTEELAEEQAHSAELQARLDELGAIVEGFEAEAATASAEAAAASDEAARRIRAEQDLQTALRTISEQNVQIRAAAE